MSRSGLLRERAAPLLLCLLLLVCLVYQAYRYPFQINSAQTSPTYSDTPTWLQLGKWGLIAVIVAMLAVTVLLDFRSSRTGASRIRLAAIGLEVALIATTSIRLIAGTSSVEPWVFLIGATTALVVTLSVADYDVFNHRLRSLLIGYAVICVAAEVVQVLLYLLIGRLPALAYAGSPSVRFGSILDDPNGFAIVLAGLIPTTWFALSERPNVRRWLVFALLCCLPLTQSWTGVTAAAVALTATYVLSSDVSRDFRRAASIAVSALIVVGVAAFFARSTIAELIRLKQGSVQDHADAFAQIASEESPSHVATAPLASASGSEPSPSATAPPPDSVVSSVPNTPAGDHASWTSGIESSYVNLYVNYGPVLLIAYVALGVIAAVLLLRGRTKLAPALRVGIASYIICFLLASANLGLDRTFPCNILYFVFCGIAFASVARPIGAPRGAVRSLHRRPLLHRRTPMRAHRSVSPVAGRLEERVARDAPSDPAPRGAWSRLRHPSDRPLYPR